MRRHLKKPLNEYVIDGLSPISMNGNSYLQGCLVGYCQVMGMTLNDIYQYVLSDLVTVDSTEIYPDSKTKRLKPTHSA